MRRRFVVRVIEPWQTCFSAMQHQISRSQVIHLCIMAPLQRGLSRAYFTYDRDCDGRLRPSPFREGIGYLRPRRFAHCIDFITDQGRSGFPLRPCALFVVVIYGLEMMKLSKGWRLPSGWGWRRGAVCGVAIYPGPMPLHWILYLPYSAQIFRVSIFSPPFAAA